MSPPNAITKMHLVCPEYDYEGPDLTDDQVFLFADEAAADRYMDEKNKAEGGQGTHWVGYTIPISIGWSP